VFVAARTWCVNRLNQAIPLFGVRACTVGLLLLGMPVFGWEQTKMRRGCQTVRSPPGKTNADYRSIKRVFLVHGDENARTNAIHLTLHTAVEESETEITAALKRLEAAEVRL